ncbi:MAG: type II secretion system F family protein [Armatimonadetes bacterium]|nr:type II secretion system F family protein [Armatimonadota bacterium]
MGEFQYKAMDVSGESVQGRVSAVDDAEALARVRELGFLPVEVSMAREKRNGATESANGSRRRVSASDVTSFTRQVSDLVSAGLPIDRALAVMIEQSDNPGMAVVLAKVRDEIRGGRALSEALAEYPRLFSPMYRNMLRAGEASGQLGEVATRLAEFLEKEQVRRSHLVSAMVYPALLLSVAVLAMVFLLTFVVPRLSGVFDDLGADLPLPTVILLGITGVISRYWWALLGGIGFGWVSLKGFAATEAGKRQIDGWVLRLPVTGRIAGRVVVSRFARSLGTLLGGGVPILDALEIAGQAAANRVTIAASEAIRDLVRQGEPVASAMAEVGHFPPVLRHMAAVGEETGDLPRMLLRVADSLDFEVDSAMRRLTTALEPAIVLVTGGFVGFIVLSILLPVFQANAAVR